MRSIPIALKEKLLNRFKVESADSMAKLRVVATEDDLLGGANRSVSENLTLSVFALLLFGFILFIVFGRPFRTRETTA